eukprot:s2834_g3.t2
MASPRLNALFRAIMICGGPEHRVQAAPRPRLAHLYMTSALSRINKDVGRGFSFPPCARCRVLWQDPFRRLAPIRRWCHYRALGNAPPQSRQRRRMTPKSRPLTKMQTCRFHDRARYQIWVAKLILLVPKGLPGRLARSSLKPHRIDSVVGKMDTNALRWSEFRRLDEGINGWEMAATRSAWSAVSTVHRAGSASKAHCASSVICMRESATLAESLTPRT